MPLREITRTQVHELLDMLVTQGMTVGVNRIQPHFSPVHARARPFARQCASCRRHDEAFQEKPSDRVLTDDALRVLVLGLDARPAIRT
jgi:hypothetical protein